MHCILITQVQELTPNSHFVFVTELTLVHLDLVFAMSLFFTMCKYLTLSDHLNLSDISLTNLRLKIDHSLTNPDSTQVQMVSADFKWTNLMEYEHDKQQQKPFLETNFFSSAGKLSISEKNLPSLMLYVCCT